MFLFRILKWLIIPPNPINPLDDPREKISLIRFIFNANISSNKFSKFSKFSTFWSALLPNASSFSARLSPLPFTSQIVEGRSIRIRVLLGTRTLTVSDKKIKETVLLIHVSFLSVASQFSSLPSLTLFFIRTSPRTSILFPSSVTADTKRKSESTFHAEI